MPAKTLYLIDGHAQIYRAYYAPFAALTSPKGEPTRAVHVFLQMLLGLLRDRRPDYLAMVLDVSDETVFRVEIDPTYKEHRDPSPEDLAPQFDRIVQIMQAIGVPILRQQGFEADDIMATLADRHAGPDLDVFLVSRDKDLDQLLNDHVRLYDPGKDRVFDVAALIEEKGYGPELAVEAQMLMGDSTDNVRGVEGVGPKKAAALLKEYGSVAAIIENADELTPKLRENVLAFRDRMETVRQLVTLRRDVSIELDLDRAAVDGIDLTAARPILSELGMNRLLERFTDAAGTAAAPAAEPAPSQGTLIDITSSPAKYELVDSEDALARLARQLAAVPAFAFDTETTGLVPAGVDLVGLSFSFEPMTGYYVPVRGLGRTLPQELVAGTLGPIFADPKVRKCGQNVKYDWGVLKSVGLELAGVDFDTMIASFVLDSSRRSHGLDALSMELLDYKPISTEEMIGRGKNQVTFEQLPTDRVCQYAAEDADVAWRLRKVLEPQLTDPELVSLFRDLEMPLVEVLTQIEANGVTLDNELLAGLSKRMAKRLDDLRDRIHAAAGRPFNIDSPKQLAELLFDERKLPVVKRTKTARSTDAEVLELLAAQTADPIPALLLEYRELSKLIGTYIDALPKLVCSRTGRVHPSYHQTGAITGRLSCSDPNLQNIPIRTEAGAQIRRAFVPSEKGSVILKADYSQVELRVLAHFSKDEALCAAFKEDRDIHAFVASQIEGVPLDQVTPQQRASAKTVNFGIVYGQSAFGLSRQTGMPLGEAKRFIDRYFHRYPRIRGFLDSCIAQAKKQGYVKTMLGRRRAVPDIHSRNQAARNAAERLAVNTVVQGTAADLIKRAMIHIHRQLIDEQRPSRMLIQVHDELVFEVPAKAVMSEARMIVEGMSRALPLDVPIKVDVATGPNWLDLEPLRMNQT